MEFISLRFTQIKAEIEAFLVKEYNKASLLFSTASPYGQILSVLENLHQLSFLYLKNTINALDLSLPNSTNTRIIRNAAINSGHIPTRSVGATGTLRVRVKSAVDIESELPGSSVTIPPRLLLKNKTNGLNYCVDAGSIPNTYKVSVGTSFFLPVIQGIWKTVTYTGSGEAMASFSVVDTSKDIDNFNVRVLVNYETWEIKRGLYDMYPGEKAVVVRTGYNGGIDVIFGNGSFGMMPPLGAVIDIRYLATDGAQGNIFRRTVNDWSIIGEVQSGNGLGVNFEKIFDIEIFNDITFGADGEQIGFTKALLPFATNNAVLALPQHFAYEIKKLGVFSHVNAYENSGTIFITVTPNVNLFKDKTANYFTVPISAFILDSYEKKKVDNYLRSNGLIMLTKKYIISSPKLSYYSINIFVIPYSDVTDDSVNSQILATISSYFFNFSRIGRIPKLDIVALLANILDIHSVDVQFVCRKNEDYHREQMTKQKNQSNQFGTDALGNTYNPSTLIGLDPVLGDIIFEADEVPIIRGGWSDRNGSYYSDDIEYNGLRAVNIFKQGVVDAKKRQ